MRRRKNYLLKVLCFFCFLSGLISFPVKAQVRPVNDYGAIGLAQILKRLATTKSVMMIGAHPDDEDSALLAYMARAENARTAYLSLTRGDGGQNIIGPELFESLGVMRTEELLQARRLDGGEQLFSRAFDYGFSKTLDEAKQKWDERILLCDTVRAIRNFRPLVVIARFTGTPADGHGQHQFSGYLAPIAVKAAADANQCKESGVPWQVLKFYVEQSFSNSARPGLRLNTGEYDLTLGRSYFEIAMEGRSQHKSQGEGRLEAKGDQFSGLNLVESKVKKVENEKSIFDGIDTSFASLRSPLEKNIEGDLLNSISDWQYPLTTAITNFNTSKPQELLPILLTSFQRATQIPESFKLNSQSKLQFENKKQEILKAIKFIVGLQIDALADRETVVPGESFQTDVKVFFPKNQNLRVKEMTLKAPGGWTVSKTEAPKENAQTFFREAANETSNFSIKVPQNAKPTQPYWLEQARNGNLFTWQPDDNQTFPFQPQPVFAEVKIEIAGTEIIFNQPIQYRYADAARGEIRRDLNVVPKLSLSLDQNLLVIPQSEGPQTRKISLSVTNNSASAISGEAKLSLPEGLQISPGTAKFNLRTKGEKAAVVFDITIPAKFKTGEFSLAAQATADGENFSQTMNIIAYPHIQTHRFYTDTKGKISLLDLKIAPVKIGYIMGSGDEVPAAIRQMGLNAELLNEAYLTDGDLSKYDTIVVGIRAFETRPDLAASNQRILDYVRNGGNLIVQYQRANQKLFPFPATLNANTRVTDENAKVTILDPGNPIFNFPNKITDEDFKNWVQERNSYGFSTFDGNYKPLLEAHDPGEGENKGGLLVAQIGKGFYIYNSYSFFRQLPAGNPGAYRLFANLLSLPKATR